MHPNLVDHLTAFIAVIETGSQSAAGRALRRPVSSINYSIVQLETQCGFPLIERARRPATLTEQGRALFAEAKSVVERARRFTSHAASLEQGLETRIRVAVDVLFPLARLTQALGRFADLHPRATFQFFNSSLATLWDDLRGGRFDMAFSLAAAIPLDMEARSFAIETLSPVCAMTHPLAALPLPLAARAFDRERQIYYVGAPEIDMERVGRVFSTDVWTVNDVEQIRQIVLLGLGWCFAASGTFEDEVRSGRIRRLTCADAQFHPARTIVAAWPVEHRPGPLGRALIDTMSEVVAEQEGASAGRTSA